MTRAVPSPELAVSSASIVEVLRRRAQVQGGRLAYTFLQDGEIEAGELSYADLDLKARSIATVLSQKRLRGERVLLLFPPGLGFIEAFFGCLYAGAVAVPAYPPGSPRGLARLAGILADARPRAVLGAAALLEKVRQWDEGTGGFAGIDGIAVDEVLPEGAGEWADPGLRSDTLAFLQYTSGSTAAPKGVMVSHGNLIHNQKLIQQAFRQDEESVIAGWLPLYHDMGLIGNVLQPLYAGGRCILMSPAAFLQRPRRWLQAISRYRATTSGGPNFAYELCAQKIGREQRAGLDLGSWQVAFNGAEPVRAETLERFARAFAPCGFRRDTFHPCYGLAESTLLVTAGGRQEPVTSRFDAVSLGAGRAAEAAEGKPARVLVGCGSAPAEVRLLVVDPESARPCATGEVGEIWVAGPSVAAGYWRRPEESGTTFTARLCDGEGPFLRTGDLGFLRDGQLFVTGRRKDLIIVRGRNHYPQDIELTAERSHAALRLGCGAAFAVEGDGEERLVVVHEVVRGAVLDVEAIADALRARVAEEHELRVHELVLLRTGALPKTTSGKVRRRACRDAYLAGGLEAVGRSAVTAGAAVGAEALDWTALTALLPEERASALAADLRQRAARVLRVPAARIAADQPLSSYGLDSLMAMELSNEIEESFGFSLDLVHLLGGLSLLQIAAELSRRRPAAPPVLADPVRAVMDQPLSYGQKALWFLHQLAPESGAYNLAAALRLHSEVDAATLRDSFQALVERHPQLRTSFYARGGEPLQRRHERVAVAFREEDATGWEEARFAERLIREAGRPFDLTAVSQLRVTLFRRAPGEQVLLLAAHHLVADFWSFAVLLQELGILYGGLRRGIPLGDVALLPPLAHGYSDHVAVQAELLAGDEGERLWCFWRGALAGELPQLDLPTDRPRPPRRSWRGGSRSRRLGRELAERLGALGRERRSTPYMVLLAGFQTLLYRYTRQVDLLVGSPSAGRSAPGFAGVVGYFVNTLVLRADLSGEPSFGTLLSRVRRTALLALDHQGFPFPLLAERLQPVRDPGGSPLVQVLFSLQRTPSIAAPGLAAIAVGEPGVRLESRELAFESIALEQRFAAFDLALEMAEVDGGLAARLTYDADLFDGSTAERLLGHLEVLLAAAVEQADLRAADLPLLTAAEERELLVTRNQTAAAWPHGLRVHDLVMAGGVRTPDAVAVSGAGQMLTYGGLEARSRHLAARLRRLGIGPETRVALCLDRSPEMLVAMLGILRAGGAYVPLDPLYPPQRLAMMLEDAQPRLLLTVPGLAAGLPPHAVPVLGLHDLAASETDGCPAREPGADAALPDSPAYVLFTSGSTGRPKGVQVTHRALANFLASMAREPGLAAADALLAVTTLSFDIAALELLLPLTVGGRVELAARWEAAEPARLAERLAASGATVMQATPATWQLLLDAGSPLPPRLKALCGGEALPRELAERLLAAGAELWNLYGPTETTVWSMAQRVTGGSGAHLGRPLANTRVYLLDPGLRPVPVGVPGELFIAGDGLARGYLGQPVMTAERFVPDPFAAAPGGRLYRSGDLARHRPGGAEAGIDFLGRIDHQVKVRGFRIELGEIETALTAHPAVREAVVTDRRDAAGEARLIAYLIPAAGEMPAPAGLLAFLRHRLPDFMLPAAFVLLDAFPRTPAGKIDRRQLPAPPAPGADNAGRSLPRGPVEELLAGLWSDLLGLDEVGREDDFFALGGHSLLASRLVLRCREAFGCDLAVRSIFEAPKLAGLAGVIAAGSEAGGASGAADAAPIPRRTGGPAPLTFGQQRLWLFDRLQPESAVYNMPAVIGLAGRLDSATLAGSLAEIVRRHEVLRTSFPGPQGEPVQRVAATPLAVLPWLPLVDLAALPVAARRREADRLAVAEARRPFHLAEGPLLRSALLRLGEEEHRLLLTAHHAVADAWSIGVFLRELEALYAAFARGAVSPLAEPLLQYGDFAAWQRERVESGALAGALDHWRRELADLSPLELPVDRQRPAVRTSRGAVVARPLGRELTAALQALGRRAGATPFMVLLAAFQELLARSTGRREVAVGAPWAGRDRAETAGLVGFFVNTLVLRAEIPAELAFEALLAATRERVLTAHAHCELPLEAVAGELATGRGPGEPLFQTVLAFEDAALEVDLPGLSATATVTATGTAKFDLSLLVRSETGGLTVAAEHSTDLFDGATVERLLRSLEALLAGAAADPGCRASELPLLGAAERQHLLVEWNRTATEPALAGTVHRLFERQAALAPGVLAVAAAGGELTYGELNRRANRLAHRLLSLGVGPERPVAVLMERSLSQIVAVLAVLKAGGAYLPLDPAYPAERLAFMVRDSGAAVVLVGEGTALPEPAAGITVLSTDELAGEPDGNPDGGAQPRNLAYLIYTSGSTGLPKAVAVEHASLLNLVDWHRNAYRVTREDRAALTAGPAFDASVWETWPYLTAGASLHVVDGETARSATRLLEWLGRRRITLCFLPTPLAELMLPAFPAADLALRALLTGGDRLHRRPASRLPFQLVNHYGPTEGTVVSTCAPVVDGDESMPPIGRPIANLAAYVLDARLQPLPIGVPGELCVGGLGLARGYRGHPDRTAERFVPDPFGPAGSRLYRTGDLARHRPDGDLEFLGRTDHQIKIRGVRIELGEVEAALLRHPDVQEAVAAVRETGAGDRRLSAGFVPRAGRPVEPADLAAFLAQHLPQAMVPSALTRLEALPLTANGKVDRTALPEPAGGPAGGAELVAPRGEVEEALAELWRDILGVHRIGVHDNFFELGGHSLKATQLLFRVQDLFEVEVPPHRFLAAPTIASLAVTVADELAGAVDDDVLSGLLGEIAEADAGHGGWGAL